MTKYTNFIKKITPLMIPTEEQMLNVANIVSRQLADYVYNAKLKSVVLGISGGLDSAVVAALARKAADLLKTEKNYDLKVIGVAIPLSTTNTHLEQAVWVGNTFCTSGPLLDFKGVGNPNNHFEILNMWEQENLLDQMIDTLQKINPFVERMGFGCNIDYKLSAGNLKSRLRMITLYDLAKKTHGLVLGTGNWSEDHAAFFYTLGGDGQVDYSMIKGVNKGFEMPVLAKVLGILDSIIEQAPSDGLQVTNENTDEAQLGATYKEIDIIINCYLGNFNPDILEEFKSLMDYETIQKVIYRYKAYKYKESGEVSIERGDNGLKATYQSYP